MGKGEGVRICAVCVLFVFFVAWSVGWLIWYVYMYVCDGSEMGNSMHACNVSEGKGTMQMHPTNTWKDGRKQLFFVLGSMEQLHCLYTLLIHA